jgi:ribonuclease P protein component
VFLLNAQVSQLNHCRIGVTASRKVGGAVVRNRAKRLVREAFRATRGQWPAGIDVVVIVRKLDASSTLRDVVDEWRQVAAKVARQAQSLHHARQPSEPLS